MSLSKEQVQNMVESWNTQRNQLLEQYRAITSETDVEVNPQTKLQMDVLFKILELNINLYMNSLVLLKNLDDLSYMPGIRFGAAPPPPSTSAYDGNISYRLKQIEELLEKIWSRIP